MAERTVLAFGAGSWAYPEFAGSPRYHLWTLAELGWRVVYVNPPDKLLKRGRIWRAKDRDFTALSFPGILPFRQRLAASMPLVGDVWANDVASRLWRAADIYLQKRNCKADVIWYGSPWHQAMGEKQPDSVRSVFHVYDELSYSPVFSSLARKRIWDWECRLMRKVDVTLCSSLPQEARRERLCERVELLENAVSEKFFLEDGAAPPKRYRGILDRFEKLPRPRIVYGGVADLRLDAEIFDALAKSFPDGAIVLMGVRDRNLPAEFRRIARDRGNLIFFGRVPYGIFPWIYRESDVLILAHQQTSFTKAMFSEKLNEYLSSGKPIVACPLPEVKRLAEELGARDGIRLASRERDFVFAVKDALNDEPMSLKTQRIGLGKTRTWKALGKKLEEILNEILHKGKIATS